MAAMAPETVGELESLRHMARLTHIVVRANAEGVSHAESLAHPQPAGNCMNWVVGHLVCIYNNALPFVGQEPVTERAAIERYDRGSAPLTDPTEAVEFDRLLALWDEASARMDAGLASFPADTLDQKAPFSPSNDPDETVRSLLGTIVFHQAYHAGQTGVLRRVAGKPGAIK